MHYSKLFCGGIHQADNPGRNCGVCGDPPSSSAPRPNEVGGRWYRGIITGYYQSGQVIEVAPEFTVEHKGFMEWRLCTDHRQESQNVSTKICFNEFEMVWRVRYNGFHDQLVLTAASDSRILLHCLPTISSEAKGNRQILSDVDNNEDEDNQENSSPPLQEGILSRYEDNGDDVYAVEWSTLDPWTFASLSYDGRLVINRIPK